MSDEGKGEKMGILPAGAKTEVAGQIALHLTVSYIAEVEQLDNGVPRITVRLQGNPSMNGTVYRAPYTAGTEYVLSDALEEALGRVATYTIIERQAQLTAQRRDADPELRNAKFGLRGSDEGGNSGPVGQA